MEIILLAKQDHSLNVQMQKEELSCVFYCQGCMRVSARICARCQRERQTRQEENWLHHFQAAEPAAEALDLALSVDFRVHGAMLRQSAA